ncbi:MAG: hypothetical protein M0Q90_06535 [Bacteroidales bacterium]|jgi:hypothetical protein|nr:hypothetical protein [Bacteroidales bacterium]MDY0075702.1 hypothetical protein [Bacteroidales bacterium]
MSIKWKNQYNRFVTLLLRFSVIAYLLYTLLPYVINPGFENTMGSWVVRWFLIILLGAIAMLAFVLRRTDLLRYGFFLVLIAAAFNLFTALLLPEKWHLLLLHTYVIATAIYFISRDIRIETSKTHRRRTKNN